MTMANDTLLKVAEIYDNDTEGVSVSYIARKVLAEAGATRETANETKVLWTLPDQSKVLVDWCSATEV